MTSNSPKTENLFPKRYSRLEIIKSIGKEGLQKIRQGKVFILGCGALGSLSAMYLAASGVGTIGIADFDTIDATNLQRQLFYSEDIVGSAKVLELANKMSRLNSDIHLEVFNEMITARKAEKIFAGYDFIIDGSDNMSTKQMTSSVCEKINKPYCIGGVEGFAGQVMS
ncbi:MAG: HesA/MoeB/ThiF family protein, partial [Paramuribaculum sp.]|nr:HesA/MoeB/ThiF family protein [Paramuribaculum sp.]